MVNFFFSQTRRCFFGQHCGRYCCCGLLLQVLPWAAVLRR
jgi:hypothetical protein